MNVVITGAAGFLGRKLARAVLDAGALAGRDGSPCEIAKLTLFDVVAYDGPEAADSRVRVVAGDINDAATVADVIADDAASVFHLAAVVSGAAEADFDLGMRVNLYGAIAVLDRCRALRTKPKLVFASSLATYGGDMPPTILDQTPQTPQTSYGVQKAAGELLVHDYSRKGFIDGRSLRLPTICVRTGKPNKAASTFASSILREPLCGLEATCPVSPDTQLALMSPRKVIQAFLRVHDLPAKAFGATRSLLLPGITVSVQDMVDALDRQGGQSAVDLIRWAPDAVIQNIVSGWPTRLAPARAPELGFEGDASMDDIVAGFIEDDLEAQKASI